MTGTVPGKKKAFDIKTIFDFIGKAQKILSDDALNVVVAESETTADLIGGIVRYCLKKR